MTFDAGKHPQHAGRPPGAPNKATAKGREAIAQFVDGNADRLVGWLDKIAEESPKDAFNAFMSVVEYHIPKLQRKELVGDPEKPLVLEDRGAEAKARTERLFKALAEKQGIKD